MARPKKYSDEFRRRAVDEVLERGRKIPELASSLGITSNETLRRWVRQAEADRGLREAPTAEELAEIKKLRKEVADQQRTIAILKAATAFFRPGAEPPLAVRVAFIDAYRERWPVAVMCRAIGLSERTYHARKSRPLSARAVRDEALKVDIDRVFKENYSCYGARRVWIALRRADVEAARCTVERLMADMGLRGVQRGKKLFTTVADSDAVRPPDLVCRQFTAERPNQLWLADITYCSTWRGRAGCTCQLRGIRTGHLQDQPHGRGFPCNKEFCGIRLLTIDTAMREDSTESASSKTLSPG